MEELLRVSDLQWLAPALQIFIDTDEV